MSLVPVYFRLPSGTAGQADLRNTVRLAPTPTSVALLQVLESADPTSSGNRFDIRDVADDLKRHSVLRE